MITSPSHTRRAAALVLAAGLSTRMGRPKPLLPWGGRTLVAAQVAALREAGIEDVVVVTGHEADAVAAALAETEARTAHNPSYRDGRATSVRTGARALHDDSDPIVVLNVDQPRPPRMIRAVLDAHRAAAALITVPRHGGRRGHPVVFAGELLEELRAVTEEGEGLRAIRRRHAGRTLEVEVDDGRILLDANTPEAYAEALAAFGLA